MFCSSHDVAASEAAQSVFDAEFDIFRELIERHSSCVRGGSCHFVSSNDHAPRHCHMGKRARRSSICPKHQRDKHLEDRLSLLPDGILVHILSLLKIREAGRSSVLSHRWRDLWKFTTSLNFDASETMRKLIGENPLQERSNDSCDIDAWINFVIPKRVKLLAINLQPFSRAAHYKPSEECYLCFKSPSNLSSIKCLTSLSLSWVNVNGELIEYFLSNCPNLEQLRLFCLEQIVNLKVSGPSLQLKHLDIFRCKSLESLEFCAPKLVTFKYFGKPIRLSIGSLPLLAELDIGVSCGQPTFVLEPFSSYFSQIETLKLNMWLPEDYVEIPQFPEFTKLKHLTLDISNHFRSRFPCFTSLIKAAPSLHKFTFKMISYVRAEAVLSKTLTLHPHECLKDVEMFGFVDWELVMYLLQNATNLEKITIDPYYPIVHSRKHRKNKLKEEARKRAHQLREKLPSAVKLIVL